MNKSMIALAVLAGFAGVASAQSSVTLSGSIDAGVRRIDGVNDMAGAGSSRNNLTFSGVEDLGGGNSAFFTLNHRFNVQSGTQNGQNSVVSTTAAGLPNAADPAAQFYRNVWVGLKNNAIGDLRLGRFLYPVQELNGNYDAFGTDTVGSTHTGGLKANLRTNSSAYLRSANFAGFQLHLATGFKNNGQTNQVVAATPPATGFVTVANTKAPVGAAAVFATGPMSVALAYDSNGAELTTKALYGSYDLGVAKLMAQYEKTDVNVAQTASDKRYSFSATIPVGALSKAKVGYLHIDDTTKAGTQSKFGAGFDFGLSKRTTVYTDVAKLRGDEGLTTNNKKVRFDIGVNHKF
ncbi:outer membrane porin [Leptothrix cholodnii SP-6]|uniref:Outer membrane porin n=1 Tax=Leptothrix cholodnii (strain ATCC 51168 / LMG 8142 / SP-6) TaxID=395495 RepID=B1Y315_LEPCP|nr:porin [Leptothrix cholodnii]ACB35671.1 outer membrane porin [Leptothrix cholodnii SP-6]